MVDQSGLLQNQSSLQAGGRTKSGKTKSWLNSASDDVAAGIAVVFSGVAVAIEFVPGAFPVDAGERPLGAINVMTAGFG